MSVESKVRAYILENFLFTDDQSVLNSSESLLDNGTMDSTGVLEVINFLEEEFGITVADEEMIPDNLDSVGRIVSCVGRKVT